MAINASSLQLFRSASADFSTGNRSFSANASSLTSNHSENSTGIIPSINVAGSGSYWNSGASRLDRAIGRIVDIIAQLDQPEDEHTNAKRADTKRLILENLDKTDPESVLTVTAKMGGQTFEAIKGTKGNDVIGYGSLSQATLAYIDAGDGDDSIVFVSTTSAEHKVYGGAGDDTITFSASDGRVYGGAGDDVIAVAGLRVDASGGAGDDVITVTGAVVAAEGGDGDDTITVSGDVVTSVEGGDGNDTITVTSETVKYRTRGEHVGLELAGEVSPTEIEGGKGNDTININGEGRVILRAGEGQDTVSITDRTEFFTFGNTNSDNIMRADQANFTYEDGTLTVSFEGRDEMLTISAANGKELSWEITSDRMFVVTLK